MSEWHKNLQVKQTKTTTIESSIEIGLEQIEQLIKEQVASTLQISLSTVHVDVIWDERSSGGIRGCTIRLTSESIETTSD